MSCPTAKYLHKALNHLEYGVALMTGGVGRFPVRTHPHSR